MFCILYIFSHLSLCILLQQGFSLLGQKCQIRKTEFWWKFGAHVFLLWWKYILFELRKSDSICRWYQIRKIEVIEQTWNKYMLKLKAGNLKKWNKKVFSLCWDLVIISSSRSSSRMEFPKYFPGILVYWMSSSILFPSDWGSHWQVLVVTRGWDRARWWIPMCLPSVLSCEYAKSNDQSGAERSTTNFWPSQHHQYLQKSYLLSKNCALLFPTNYALPENCSSWIIASAAISK